MSRRGRAVQPHLKANVWSKFSGDQAIRLAGDPIIAGLDPTIFDVGGGITVDRAHGIGLFAAADYKANPRGQRTSIFGGIAGFSVKW